LLHAERRRRRLETEDGDALLIVGILCGVAAQQVNPTRIAGEPHDATREDRDRDRLQRLLYEVRNVFRRETGDVARHRDD
jgi:hypothetical protein